MFICAVCKEANGPYVSPIVSVTGRRDTSYVNWKTYYNENEERVTEKIDSKGHEITGTINLCAKCSGDSSGIKETPSNAPRVIFQEKLPDPLKIPMIAIVIDSTLERIEHSNNGGVRAHKDIAVAVPLIKHFTDDNKEFKF